VRVLITDTPVGDTILQVMAYIIQPMNLCQKCTCWKPYNRKRKQHSVKCCLVLVPLQFRQWYSSFSSLAVGTYKQAPDIICLADILQVWRIACYTPHHSYILPRITWYTSTGSTIKKKYRKSVSFIEEKSPLWRGDLYTVTVLGSSNTESATIELTLVPERIELMHLRVAVCTLNLTFQDTRLHHESPSWLAGGLVSSHDAWCGYDWGEFSVVVWLCPSDFLLDPPSVVMVGVEVDVWVLTTECGLVFTARVDTDGDDVLEVVVRRDNNYLMAPSTAGTLVSHCLLL